MIAKKNDKKKRNENIRKEKEKGYGKMPFFSYHSAAILSLIWKIHPQPALRLIPHKQVETVKMLRNFSFQHSTGES